MAGDTGTIMTRRPFFGQGIFPTVSGKTYYHPSVRTESLANGSAGGPSETGHQKHGENRIQSEKKK